MTGAPDNRLARLKRNRATFMGAFRAEGEELIARLKNNDALPAHRDDDEFLFLELGRIFARQSRRPGRAGLRQRLEITNDRISNGSRPSRARSRPG